MAGSGALRRRLAVLGVVLLLVLAAGAVYWRSARADGQTMSIPGSDPGAAGTPWPARATRPGPASGPPFVAGVGSGGRHLVDQYGRPFLLRGDSPWSLMTRLTPADAQVWFADRQAHGVNAALVSLLGAKGNGGPDDDGGTVDGLHPFVDGDILRWQQPYWDRVTSYIRLAGQHGITVLLYPIDGWTIGTSFTPSSIGQCQQYGRMLAQRFAGLPNIVWLSGGDYFPGRATDDLAAGSDVDHCIDATMRALRTAGDPHLFSIQLGYDRSVSTENPFWAPRVDWNFVYTYYPTYQAVLAAYAHRPPIPAVLGEANYEGENNQKDTPDTTDETLRRQVLWSLTSGSSGEIMGSQDWQFPSGWRSRLDTPAVQQIQRLTSLFAGLEWWKLVPDTENRLVTGGRGTQVTTTEPMDVLDNDYVTASRTPDGRLATIYLPARTTITVDTAQLAPGSTARWVDPVSGQQRSVPVSGRFVSPGPNAGGDGDWLLLLTAPET